MASLTPGTLQNLLQNVGNKDYKGAGEHRSPLLQVISIVPSLGDDPWKSRGFYLRVSDSLHSAYVSVSDEDVDMVLSDHVQLGQFIHVSWLDSGSPVPILRGIKPIPKRRPCVGEPKDLISSDFLNVKKLETKPGKSNGKVKNVRRLSFGYAKVVGDGGDGRRLSLDSSSRKGWDSTPRGGKGVAPRTRLKDDGSNLDVVAKSVLIPEDVPKSSPLKSKNGNMITPKVLKKPDRSSVVSLPNKGVMKLDGNSLVSPPKNKIAMKLDRNSGMSSEDNICLNKVMLNIEKGSERGVSCDALPSTICDLGKEVQSRKTLAFTSAADSLEEASLCAGVVQCLSMFAELCDLSRKDSTGPPLVEQFFSVQRSIKKASAQISSVISRTDKLKDKNRSASLWVRAAIQTDLSKFSLYKKSCDQKGHYIIIDNTSDKIDTESRVLPKTKKTTTASRKPSPKTSHLSSNISKRDVVWFPGSGLKYAAQLAEMLLWSTRAWFLDYLERSLDDGFGLKGVVDEGHRTTVLLGQLKRVNQWLDDEGGTGVEDERIQQVKKKLYRFLLDHIGSC